MKRNTLFYALLAMVLSFAASTQTFAKKAAKKEVCIQLFSVRSILDGVNKDGQADQKYTDILNKLAKMGYTSVEAANYDQGRGTFYGRTAAQFKQDVEKAGMKVLSSHVGHGLPWMDVPKTLKDLDTYCRYYNEVGKMCKEAGMSFGYHNHSHEFQKVEDKVMYDYMLEHTNPEYVFFQMDLYWVVRGQCSPVAYFKRYPGRFKMYHVKDDKEIGQSGMVGYDAIFRNADVAGVQDIVAEIEQYTMPVEESVEVSLRYLQEAPFVKASYSK